MLENTEVVDYCTQWDDEREGGEKDMKRGYVEPEGYRYERWECRRVDKFINTSCALAKECWDPYTVKDGFFDGYYPVSANIPSREKPVSKSGQKTRNKT